MPKVQKNFIKGRMNKSVDERLVPQGEYIDALNVRLGSTEGTEIGAVENSKGNELLVQLTFLDQALSSEAKCIGAYEDGANETIYWFVHDKNNPNSSTGKVDLLVSYNTRTFVLFYHLISTSILNFDEDYLVNGIDLIGDLLFFTDNLNPPRKINVTRTYLQPDPNTTVDQMTEQDIGVILAPPLNAPVIEQFKVGGGENYMEELLLSFAYRWQYEDGEYSALSPFSEYAFTPGPFEISYANFDNEGMRNIFNSVNITFNTGGRNVKDLDVIFKFSTSQSVNVIERFNKVNEGWGDNTEQTITFTNKKIYTALPEEQLLRLFDNVPRTAQAQTIMGNRLMYGNYIDGYDIVDENGADVYLDYDLSLVTEELSAGEIEGVLSDNTYSINGNITVTDARATVDFGGPEIELVEGAQIGIALDYVHDQYSGDPLYDDGSAPENEFQQTFIFNLTQDYPSVYAMATSAEFIQAVSEFVAPADSDCFPFGGTEVGTSLTDLFACSIVSKTGWDKKGFGLSSADQGFEIIASQGSTEITLVIPAFKFEEIAQPNNFAYEYFRCVSAEGLYSKDGSRESLHSNRDYEVGVVYMDEYGRSSTALVDTENTVFVPCENSITKNQIKVTMNSYPPYWATKYKFVIKESKGLYRTIYSNIFFQEEATGNTFFLLQGDNRDKVQDNATLFVKADTTGATQRCTTTKVLSFASKTKDFLCEKDANGDPLPTSQECGQPGGVYMEARATNYRADKVPNAFIEVEDGDGDSLPFAFVSCSLEDPDNPGQFIDWDVPAGSIVEFEINASRNKRGSKCGSRKYNFEKRFVAGNDHDNLYDFVRNENIRLDNGVITGTDDTLLTIFQQDTLGNFPDQQVTGSNGNSYIQFQRDAANNQLFLTWNVGTRKCSPPDKRGSYCNLRVTINRATSLMIFETEPLDANDELYFENKQTFDIVNGYHLSGNIGDDQPQTANQPAIVNLSFFNCYVFGNGAESNHVLDGLTKPVIGLGEKVTSVSEEEFQEANRFADITYSGVFNQETNLNKLNQFNLALANFKTLETSYGPIRKMHARQTDILTLQEDKISYVLVGKNLLSDAAAGGAITSVPEVLGTQLARIEEYGISNNPESFASYGYDVFFTDAKRSSVIQLKGGSAKTDKLGVISQVGMRSWFRDLFTTSFETQKLGGFDPYMNEYVISSNTSVVPQEPIERACGYVLNIADAQSPYELSVNFTTLIGPVNLDFNVTSGAVDVVVNWNGAEVLNNVGVTGQTQLTWDKTDSNPTNATITITPNTTVQPGKSVDYSATFNCPEANTITVKQIVVNFAGDAALTTTTRYRWEDGNSISPFSTNNVVLEEDGVSLFNENTGAASFGTLPPAGATIIMESRQGAGQTFVFDSSINKFKYLESQVDYDEVDIPTLLPLLNDATPITGGPQNYQASFTLTTLVDVDPFLYLVWDLREPTPIELCYDSSSPTDACCDCGTFSVWEVNQCLAATPPGQPPAIDPFPAIPPNNAPVVEYFEGTAKVDDIIFATNGCRYIVVAEAPGTPTTITLSANLGDSTSCGDQGDTYELINGFNVGVSVDYIPCYGGTSQNINVPANSSVFVEASEFTNVPPEVNIELSSCGCSTP